MKKKILIAILAALISAGGLIGIVVSTHNGNKDGSSPSQSEYVDGASSGSIDDSSSAHTHNFTLQNLADEYLKSEANCSREAVYYYSCECGEKGTETFEYGELAEHTLDNDGICTVCDSVIEDTKGITYTLSSDETYYSVTGYTGTATRVRIAESYNGLPVKAISNAFEDCSKLTSVIIGNGVTSIGGYAFRHCSKLTSVIIGNGVTSIGYEAFYGCSSLTSVTIPDSVTSIGLWAFRGCSKLIVKDNGVHYVGNWVIGADSSIASVIMKEGTRGIADSAFADCSELTSVTIPDSVTSIGRYAFYGCSKLTSVNYTGTIDQWVQIAFSDDDSSNPLYYAKKLYINNELVTEAKITTATKISAYAFYGCESLTSVTIPDSVTSIGSSSFEDCSKLTSVIIGNGVTSIGRDAFYGCSKLFEVINKSNLDITKGSEDNGRVAYYALNVKTKGASDIVNVDGYLFYTYNGTNYLLGYTGNQTALVLPDKYNGQNYEIYKYAFYNCSALTSVTIGDSVTSIGASAFSGCTALTSVTIGEDVTSIGDYAFASCYKLVEVINKSKLNITKDGSSYGDVAYYALNVKTGGASEIVNAGDYLFYTVDDTNYLFGYTGNQTALTLPDKYDGKNYEIYQYAFEGCSSLTSVTIGNGVTSIGRYAFEGCSSLTSVYYKGTETGWNNMSIDNHDNSYLTSATRYYYSESNPFEGESAVEGGNYWHYDTDGKTPVVWTKN